MISVNKTTLFLEADEIDHVTIRYTDFGEELNVKKSVRFIRNYSAKYPEVKALFDGEDISIDALYRKDEKTLYEMLVKIRTVLLDKVWQEQN